MEPLGGFTDSSKSRGLGKLSLIPNSDSKLEGLVRSIPRHSRILITRTYATGEAAEHIMTTRFGRRGDTARWVSMHLLPTSEDATDLQHHIQRMLLSESGLKA